MELKIIVFYPSNVLKLHPIPINEIVECLHDYEVDDEDESKRQMIILI